MAFDFPASPAADQEFTPAGGPTYIFKSPVWKRKVTSQSSGGGGAATSVSDGPPASPTAGQLWYESDSGNTFIWYNDGNTQQWVQVNAATNLAGDFTSKSYVDTADALRVLKSGDTMSGNLVIEKATPQIQLKPLATGDNRQISGMAPDNTSRWIIRPGNTTAESGSNSGSDFEIAGRNDAGALLNIPILITRSSGLITLGKGQLQFPATANPSTDANTFDDYREADFVPTVTFGGAAVGMTYGTRYGYSVKAGGFVWFSCEINLTAKGTSTGSAVVGGLPYAASKQYSAVSIPYYINMTMTAGTDFGLGGLVFVNSTVNLYLTRAASTAVLVDTNFTNTSRLILSGCYPVY